MSETKFDFSALAKLNLPEIPFDTASEEVIKGGEEVDINAAKEAALMEVDSLADFEKITSNANTEETAETGEAETDPADKTSEEDAVPANDKEESAVRILSEWAKEKGIFSYTDEEFQDSEDFIEAKLEEKTKSLNEKYKDDLPPIIKELINNYEEGVPLDELVYSKSREIEYLSLKEDQILKDVNLQKRLIGDWLGTQDFTDAEIAKRIEKLEDAAMLEDEAITAINKLQKFEHTYQEELKQRTLIQRENLKKEQEVRLSKIQSEIMAQEEFIPGVKRSKAEKEKIFEAYTKLDRTGKTEFIKELEKDPKIWYKLVDFVVLMKGDVSSIKKSINTEASRKLKETVNTYQENTGTSKLTSPGALKTIKKAVEASIKARNS